MVKFCGNCNSHQYEFLVSSPKYKKPICEKCHQLILLLFSFKWIQIATEDWGRFSEGLDQR